MTMLVDVTQTFGAICKQSMSASQLLLKILETSTFQISSSLPPFLRFFIDCSGVVAQYTKDEILTVFPAFQELLDRLFSRIFQHDNQLCHTMCLVMIEALGKKVNGLKLRFMIVGAIFVHEALFLVLLQKLVSKLNGFQEKWIDLAEGMVTLLCR